MSVKVKIREIDKYKRNEDWMKVYNYWKTIPSIIQVSADVFSRVVGQETRSIILDILRNGIVDDISNELKLPNRRVLSAQELLPLVNAKLNEKGLASIKLSNIYFHLDQLMDSNIIKEVITILEGRHYRKFFGRTAKLFLGVDETKSEYFGRETEKLINFILKVNGNIDQDKIMNLIKNHDKMAKISKDRFVRWAEQYQEQISESDIDLLEIFNNIFYMDFGISNYESNLQLLNLLKFPKDE